MRALIVEDDFVSRMVLQKMISAYGQCETAVNGKEALEAFNLAHQEGVPYDLICLDIMMPEMNGIEALRAIREKENDMLIHPMKEAKVVMITALDTPKDVIEAFYKGGCTSYLVKPIEKEKIVKTLKDIEVI